MVTRLLPEDLSLELLPERAQPALAAPYHYWTFDDDRVWATFHRVAEGYLVRFPGLAEFEIAADGRGAICRPCSGALAFAAASGRGKSTLAAALSRAGAPCLTDDGLMIARRGDVHLAYPGHPSIRLWDDSRAALLDGAVTAAPVSYTSKARLLSAAGLTYAAEPRSLAAAFFLGEGSAEAIRLRPLAGAEAVAAWVAHAFILDAGDMGTLDRHFDEVAMLAERVPCHLLDYPRRYDALARLRAAVLDASQATESRS